jgi:hypothetical protein
MSPGGLIALRDEHLSGRRLTCRTKLSPTTTWTTYGNRYPRPSLRDERRALGVPRFDPHIADTTLCGVDWTVFPTVCSCDALDAARTKRAPSGGRNWAEVLDLLAVPQTGPANPVITGFSPVLAGRLCRLRLGLCGTQHLRLPGATSEARAGHQWAF